MIVACPDVECSGHMVMWQRSIRYKCEACNRFFDFVLAPGTTFPPPVPSRNTNEAPVARKEVVISPTVKVRENALGLWVVWVVNDGAWVEWGVYDTKSHAISMAKSAAKHY